MGTFIGLIKGILWTSLDSSSHGPQTHLQTVLLKGPIQCAMLVNAPLFSESTIAPTLMLLAHRRPKRFKKLIVTCAGEL